MTGIGNSTAAFFNRSLDQMGELRRSIERLQTQIATGQRIERGSDDPAGAAQLRAIARREALSAAEKENASALSRDLSQAADELGDVANILIRVRELAVAAGNDTMPESARLAIADEIDQLGEELFDRANALSLAGEPLFAGTTSGPAFLRDGAGSVTYNGNGASGAVPVAPGTEIERGLPGNAIFEFDVAGTQTSAFAVLSGLADALRGGAPDPATAARAAIDGLDTALDSTTRGQAVLGTRLAWVEIVQDNQNQRAVTLAEQRSETGDTDIASAIARLQQTLTALEASQAGFARVSSLSLFDAL